MFTKGRIIQNFESIFFHQEYEYNVVVPKLEPFWVPKLCLGTDAVKLRIMS